MSGPASRKPVAVTAAAQVTKKEVAGIRNFSRVDATVGCGGATDASAMTTLKGEGFVSVINLRLANEPGADVDAGRAARTSALPAPSVPVSFTANALVAGAAPGATTWPLRPWPLPPAWLPDPDDCARKSCSC